MARSWVIVPVLLLVVGVVGVGLASGYRPRRMHPLVSPARRAEGVWRSATSSVAGGPPVLVTTLRLPGSPWALGYVAWIDHTRTQLALYPGVAQPQIAVPRGPSEVPSGERWRLLATFNGGFKYGSGSGGGGGFSVNGHTYVPLERGLGTLVGYRSGRIDITAWRGGTACGPRIAFARQDLQLLVDAGRPAAELNNQAIWGWVLGHHDPTWRTGVGIDRHGNLIYVSADDTTAALAAILIRAGANRAIELDMNPEWPTFDIYRHRHGLRPIKFVPNYQQPLDRYLKPDSRDFFAVYRRVPGKPVTVPFH